MDDENSIPLPDIGNQQTGEYNSSTDCSPEKDQQHPHSPPDLSPETILQSGGELASSLNTEKNLQTDGTRNSNSECPQEPNSSDQTQVIVANDSKFIFMIQPVDDISKIDTSTTLFGVLYGKKDDMAFNTRVIQLVQHYAFIVHVALGMYGLSLLSLLYFTNPRIQVPLLLVAIVSGLTASLPAAAVLSWDIICRVVTCFEFWYLTIVSWTFILTAFVIFPDITRELSFVVVGIVCQVTFFVDASTYLRRYVVRMFMLGVPGLVFGSALTKMGFLPNLTNISLIKGINLGAVDLAVNNSMTVAFFFGVKALPSMRLALRGDTVRDVICELYYPLCHLVPASTIPSKSCNPKQVTGKGLTPILLDDYDLIDIRNTIASQRILQAMQIITNSYAYIFLGWLGLISSCISSVWHIAIASTTSELTSEQYTLAIIGLVATSVYVFVCCLHYQRTLLYQLVLHFDMWFVAIQWSMMTMSASDRLSWDARTLSLASLWLWCNWILGLDALPPVHPKMMRHQEWLTKAVTGVLAVYPIILVYWIYCSGTPNITDNLLFNFKVYSYQISMTTSSFLSSKIPTVWMWMVRFIWYHPRTFRFIRRRLQYSVNLTPVDPSKCNRLCGNRVHHSHQAP